MHNKLRLDCFLILKKSVFFCSVVVDSVSTAASQYWMHFVAFRCMQSRIMWVRMCNPLCCYFIFLFLSLSLSLSLFLHLSSPPLLLRSSLSLSEHASEWEWISQHRQRPRGRRGGGDLLYPASVSNAPSLTHNSSPAPVTFCQCRGWTLSWNLPALARCC